MSLLAILAARAAPPSPSDPTPEPDTSALSRFWNLLDNLDTTRVAIVTAGDSLTDLGGHQEGDGWVPQYTRLLEARVGEVTTYHKLGAYDEWDPSPTQANGLHIVNTGVGGRTSYSYFGDRIYSNILAAQPTLITHMVGINNYSFTGWSPEGVVSDIVANINKTDAALTSPPIHLLMVEPRRTTPVDNRPADWWDRYAIEMRKAVEAKPNNRILADVDAAFGEAEGLRGSDGVHLTPEGNAVVAATVDAVLSQ